ncbi:hypothetical protein GW17_00050971 [Ensete ventricosum]|nr:hypothetical protein GW17_00050971 [Ensete ventricosum]
MQTTRSAKRSAHKVDRRTPKFPPPITFAETLGSTDCGSYPFSVPRVDPSVVQSAVIWLRGVDTEREEGEGSGFDQEKYACGDHDTSKTSTVHDREERRHQLWILVSVVAQPGQQQLHASLLYHPFALTRFVSRIHDLVHDTVRSERSENSSSNLRSCPRFVSRILHSFLVFMFFSCF